MDENKMAKMGVYSVYFIGSRITVNRVIFTDNQKFYVRWYGNLIEVKRGTGGYFQTVETY